MRIDINTSLVLRDFIKTVDNESELLMYLVTKTKISLLLFLKHIYGISYFLFIYL